jgi:ferredoxin
MPRVRVLPADQSAEAEAETLLELCVDARLPVPFGCTVGKCGVCRIEVVTGELEPASRFELAVLEGFQCEPGVRLACQARLAGDVTVQPLSSARRNSSES